MASGIKKSGDWLLIAYDHFEGKTLRCSQCRSKRYALVASESFREFMDHKEVNLPDGWSDNPENYTLCYNCYANRFSTAKLHKLIKSFKDSHLGWEEPTEEDLTIKNKAYNDFKKSQCGQCKRNFYNLLRTDEHKIKFDVCLNCLPNIVSEERFDEINKTIERESFRRILAIPIREFGDALGEEWLGSGKGRDLDMIRNSHKNENHKTVNGFCKICNAKIMLSKDFDAVQVDEEHDSRTLTELILASLKDEKGWKFFQDTMARIQLEKSEYNAFSSLLNYAQTIMKKHENDEEEIRYYTQEEAKQMIRDYPNTIKKLKFYTDYQQMDLFKGEIIDEFNDCPTCKGNQDLIIEGTTLEEVKKNTGDHIRKYHPKYEKMLTELGEDIYNLDINFQPPNKDLDEFYNIVGEKIPEEKVEDYKKLLNKVHYMKISTDAKKVMVGNWGLKTIHIHDKHKTDQFDWCELCQCLYIDGEPRKPTIPVKARREMSNCQTCIHSFDNVEKEKITELQQYSNTKELYESDFLKSWVQHLADDHPEILTYIQSHGWTFSFKSEGKQITITIPKPRKPIKVWRNYYQTVAFLKKKNLTSKAEYKIFCKTDECPDDIPPHPDKVYPEFKDWATYLSARIYDYRHDTKAFTPERLEEFRQEFVDNWNLYKTWTDGMITDTLRSLGLFNHKDPKVRQLATAFMDLWHDPATKQTLYEYLSKTRFNMQAGNFTVLPIVTNATTNTKYLKRKYTKTLKQKKHGLMYEEDAHTVHDIVTSSRGVKSLIPDSRYMKLIIDFTVKMIWKRIFDPRNIGELEAIQNEKMNMNEFHDKVIAQFLDEYDQVRGLKIGADYIFHHEPNLMQLYTAYKMKTMNAFFNMCRTGTGKTNAGIIATRATDSKFTLIITPNSIVDQWEDAIRACYASQVITQGTKFFDDFWSRSRFNYHIVNYDKLSHRKPASDILTQIKKLVKKGRKYNHKIDFVIVDEAQNVKVRNEEISQRRKNLDIILLELRKLNPKLKVLALSATPVINNVREGKSLLEMITGENYKFLKTSMNVESATALHTEFQPFTMRYIEKYDIEQHEHYYDVISTIPSFFTNEQIRKFHWRDHEEIMVEAKIPKMIEIIKNTTGKVIVYTEFVKGIVEKIEDALEAEKISYGLFTGEEKEGMQLKVERGGKKEILNKFVDGDIRVLIASMPIAEGVDRLQYVCNNVIFVGLPWTYARVEQITGRLVRTGQTKRDVHIHVIRAIYNGFNYDQRMKLDRLAIKKALGNCVIDGTIPNFSDIELSDNQKKHFYEVIIKNHQKHLKKEFLKQ